MKWMRICSVVLTTLGLSAMADAGLLTGPPAQLTRPSLISHWAAVRDGASFWATSRASARDIPAGRSWAGWGAGRGFFCRAWKEFMLIAANLP